MRRESKNKKVPGKAYKPGDSVKKISINSIRGISNINVPQKFQFVKMERMIGKDGRKTKPATKVFKTP